MDVPTLIERIDAALPDFDDFLRSDDNCFPLDTHEGIFAACTQYVRNRHFSEEEWEALAGVVNDAAELKTESGEAPCASFLDTLASPGHKLESSLQGAALAYWQSVCPAE